MIKKVKNTVPWTNVIGGLSGGKIIGKFQERELQKANQKELSVEKIIKKKSNKLYLKWKGYDSSFNN